MRSMWVNIVIVWSRSRKLAHTYVGFGPFWAVIKVHRPTFGVVGHQPQLVASFLYQLPPWTPCSGILELKTAHFLGAKIPKSRKSNSKWVLTTLQGYHWVLVPRLFPEKRFLKENGIFRGSHPLRFGLL